VPRLDDTIAAISSAVGPAARMIVRASGAEAPRILEHFCPRPPLGASLTVLRFDSLRFGAWVYRFAAGHSYTGDELVELHLPGNPLLARMVLERIISLGARAAEPGEFTARAYFHGRMDLSQAEGVAAVVAAANQAELDAGRRLMAGELSRRLRPMMDELAGTLALIEAEIDFSDQEVRFIASDELNRRLDEVRQKLAELLQNSARLSRLSHEPRVALAGRPNAGKSTLLNALSKSARAVVSPTAGTTRDALSAWVCLDRGMVWLVDMAGLEESAAGSEIELKMRERALRELEQADLVVLVRDAADQRPALELARKADLMVLTKIDLSAGAAGCIGVSAVTGQGLDGLRSKLDALAFGDTGGELALTVRHIGAIEAGLQAVKRARACAAAELMAAELRGALDALGQVLGDVTPDDILGRVFSTFCIGK
jgi:tRNA modification GTPase